MKNVGIRTYQAHVLYKRLKNVLKRYHTTDEEEKTAGGKGNVKGKSGG